MQSDESTSNVLKSYQESNAWDPHYGLPVVPRANNPWIYGAYALKTMRAGGLLPSEELVLLERFRKFADECRIIPGLFDRWPSGDGGVTSWDELLGMSYLLPELAREILAHLELTGGVYCNKDSELDRFGPDHFNVYRLIFLAPYLAARAGHRVSVGGRFNFALHVIGDYLTRDKDDTGDLAGVLRMWLMIETMQKVLGLATVIGFWRHRMQAQGLTPKKAFSHYLVESPVFHEHAPTEL